MRPVDDDGGPIDSDDPDNPDDAKRKRQQRQKKDRRMILKDCSHYQRGCAGANHIYHHVQFVGGIWSFRFDGTLDSGFR